MRPFLLILVFSLFWSITPAPREAVAGVLVTSPSGVHVDSSRMMHEPDDYLWLVQYPDPRHLSAHFQELIRMLAASRVSSVAAAESAAINYRFRTGAGILAEEWVRATGLIILGRDVAGFANHDDMVWVVRISYQSYKVTQELWIDATSGRIRTMLP